MTDNDESLELVKHAIREAGLRATPARIAILQLLSNSTSPQPARYKNSATGFDTDFPGFFGPEQKPSTPHVDTTSDAHQVQNRRRSLQSEKQSVAADRCLEPAADYLSQNGRDAGYTSPSQFEELGPCADC